MHNVHIYAPKPVDKAVVAATCIDCGKRTRMLSFFTPYHGWDSTCIRCGRTWCDSEWMALPFIRGARQKSIDAAKNRFRQLNILES